jgi:hypothetical protein
MAAPRRDHQQGLTDRVPALGRAGEKELANIVGARGIARLARRDRIDAGARQRRDQVFLLRRFAGALAALDGDERAALQCCRPKMR